MSAISSTTVSSDYGTLYLFKIGKIVQATTTNISGTFSSYTTYTLFTIPDGYLPRVQVTCYQLRGNNFQEVEGLVKFTTDGTVDFIQDGTSSVFYQITVTYIAAD